MKLLRAEYNRRAQLRPLLWESTIQLPLEKVYTRLKIVSKGRGGNQGETERWSNVIWAEDSRRDATSAEARANKANPCDGFAMLKENKQVMTIVEGSPGIGKTTFCLKLAYEWANQSNSAVSFPEFELVLLLKCRDIEGDLTEALTEQLFPKDLSKDAREELFRFLEDIENQERILIILDGLDELAEQSKHFVDDLLHRERWACCYVLATTRQEKGIEVRQQPEFVFNLFLQIEGFTEEDSFEYIRRHFKNAGPEHSSKGEKLVEEIKDNKLLRDLQSNPLNLLLLCIVYEDHEGKLPSSRTNLYQVIVVCLLRRYCARHKVKASKEDMDLEKQFKGDILCLGELAWNCLLYERHSFFEEELQKLERRNDKLVVRELGFVYKEESLKRLKPQHEYCFLHKSFQEYLAASYIAPKLRRNKFNVFEHLTFYLVVQNLPQVFVFVCGILREEASILFAQIGKGLKSVWDWDKCSYAAADFFIDSWSESGNAEGMANTLCSRLPFPRVVYPTFSYNDNHLGPRFAVLWFCRRFSKVAAPDEIHLKIGSCKLLLSSTIMMRDLPSLPNLKSLDFTDCDMDVELALEFFEVLPDFASLTRLVLPYLPEITDWGIVAKALTTSENLERVGCTLLGERGDGLIRALDAGLCADTPLSSVDLTICGPVSETVLQALEKLLLRKSLSSVSVKVDGDMSHSLAVTLSRALAFQTALKNLELVVKGKLSFYCANLIEQGIVKNNSLSELKVCLDGELPDNWQVVVENLNVRLTEKSTVTLEIYPNTFRQVTAHDFRDVCDDCVEMNGFFEQKSVTLNVWGELTVDGAEAMYSVLPCTSLYHLTLNIHGKLTDDFLDSTARHVDNQEPLCPITINTWNQLTSEEEVLFKELELDKNRAVTLNVFDKHVPSDESGDNKIVSIDNPKSLIKLLEEAENTGKENLAVTINFQSDDSTCDNSDDSTHRSWNDGLLPCLPRNCSLNFLTLTMNNFSPGTTELSFILISRLENFISLKSLTLTLNEYNEWKKNYGSLLRKGLGRNTSLISLTLTLNIYNGTPGVDDFDCGDISGDDVVDISDDDVVPNIPMDSFTLTINEFSGPDGSLERVGDIYQLFIYVWGLRSGDLWANYKSLNTFNLTLNNIGLEFDSSFPAICEAIVKANSLRTLRLKLNRSLYINYDFSKLVEKIPSLELIELTICHERSFDSSKRGVFWLETLKWEKQ